MLITANGTYVLNQPDSKQTVASVIYTSALGGASVSLKVHDVILTDGVLSDNSQAYVTHGVGAKLVAVVTGFTSSFNLDTYRG